MDSAARLKHVKETKLQRPEVKVSYATFLTTKLLQCWSDSHRWQNTPSDGIFYCIVCFRM